MLEWISVFAQSKIKSARTHALEMRLMHQTSEYKSLNELKLPESLLFTAAIDLKRKYLLKEHTDMTT